MNNLSESIKQEIEDSFLGNEVNKQAYSAKQAYLKGLVIATAHDSTADASWFDKDCLNEVWGISYLEVKGNVESFYAEQY